MTSEMQGYLQIKEPVLLFANKEEDIHPLMGLTRYGPYSIGSPSRIIGRFLCPRSKENAIKNLIKELNSSSDIIPYGKDYFVSYSGFPTIFKSTLELDTNCNYLLPSTSSINSKTKLNDFLSSFFSRVAPDRISFNILFVFLPKELEMFYEDVKMVAAKYRIPIQILKEETLKKGERVNILWGLSIAVYAKSGGIPWKLKALDRNEAFLGISYSLKVPNDGTNIPRYVTCCSQVFESDGTGFDFVAYNTKDYTLDRAKNPYLTYMEMSNLLSKSLSIYQNGRRGNIPHKIFIHKNTAFRQEEINACQDTLGNKASVELLQLIQSSQWRGVRIDAPREASQHPCFRGTYLVLSNTECLLWVQGAVPLLNASNYYKEAYSIPKVLLIRRFLGDTNWHEICMSILGLSKMDWNTNQLYKKYPVTLGYSQKFAQLIQNQSIIYDEVYSYIYFM